MLKELVSVTCDYNRKLKEKNNADGTAKKFQEKCQALQDENNELTKQLKQAEDKITELKTNIKKVMSIFFHEGLRFNC